MLPWNRLRKRVMAEQKFEKDLEKLEKIAEALEEGDLSLDESLKRFEEGITLAKRCEKALAQAEKKIEILTKNAEGELEAQPFGDETEASAAEPSPPANTDSDGDAPAEDELPF